MILVSPGFLSETLQPQLDKIVDRALREQVIISSVDRRGLATLMPMVDASRGNRQLTGVLAASQDMSTQQRETAATSVLAEVADGTGGEYFHNDNDQGAGFDALTESRGYVLAFNPGNLKMDGRFHSLKVILREKPKGDRVQARRGYLADKPDNVDEATQAKEEIREMLTAAYDLQQLPVEVTTAFSKQATAATSLR